MSPCAPVRRARRVAVRLEPRCGDRRVERWRRDERKAFQVACALGRGNRLSLNILDELRLILRLMRYQRMAVEFGAIVAAVCDETVALAAE